MGLVVNRIRPAVNAAYQKNARATIDVSLKAVYKKLENLETGHLGRDGRHDGRTVGDGHHDDERRHPATVAGLSHQDPRRQPSARVRSIASRSCGRWGPGPLPGQALVVLDPELMLVIDAFLCEDGHAQERSLLGQVEEIVRPKDLWIDDRNFCTTGFLFGIARREGFFLVRQHAATLHWVHLVGKRRDRGRMETGRVFEQTVRVTNDAGEVLFVRRVTVVLDKPTRDGDGEIHMLTNVPVKHASARVVADLYRRRWTIETAFAEMEKVLNGEINTLGYPKAALFSFCMALVAYNVLSTVKGACARCMVRRRSRSSPASTWRTRSRCATAG